MPCTACSFKAIAVRVAPLLPHRKALRCDEVQVDESVVTLHVRSCLPKGRCPSCGHDSNRVHSWYERSLTDLPWHGQQVRIRWRSRKFFCSNADCQQRIFAERVPAIAAAYGRQTRRLVEALRAIAMACGGEPGARLANRLGMSVSGDGLLRLLRRAPQARHPTPRVLGVDDFAFRKGFTYGTILCDLVRRRPIDLLPERSKDSFCDWLSRNPGTEIISRDRGEYYCQGATEGAPLAAQAADRWHLLCNLRDAVARWLGRIATEWRKLVPTSARSSNRGEEASSSHPSLTEQLRRTRRQQRLQHYRKSRAVHRRGWDYRRIGRKLGIHANTVRKFVQADQFPERVVPARTRRTDSFVDYLRERWEQGCRNAHMLHAELTARGFAGSYDAVRRCVAPWRDVSLGRPGDRPAVARRMSADQLAWLLIQPTDNRTDEDEQLACRLSQQGEQWSQGVQLAAQFPEAMRRRDGELFDAWLASALRKDVPREIRRFANGLRRDLKAVRMAFTSPWSNGQTEGHVNRLKLIKRQMYGRAGFDLLRIRFLNAA